MPAGQYRGPRLILASLFVLATIAACGGAPPDPAPTATEQARTVLRIMSGSENGFLTRRAAGSTEPTFQERFEQANPDIALDFAFMGSIDIKSELEKGDATEFDVAFPANQLWIQLGDTSDVVAQSQSVMLSPVVFGVKHSVAERLGWVGRDDVTMDEILQAVESGQVRFAMTNATQSHSGSAAFLAFLYAFAGNPEVISPAMLQDPDVQDKVGRILASVDRSSGSSGFLKDYLIDPSRPEHYEQLDGMFNYESLIIEANQALAAQNQQAGAQQRELLYAVTPVEGLGYADSPLAYIDHGDEAKKAAYDRLLAFFGEDQVQDSLRRHGRRLGFLSDSANVDEAVFNPDWGIDIARPVKSFRYPDADVLNQALNLYTMQLRKPALTVLVADVSGSMGDDGKFDKLLQAMDTLLITENAARYFIQASPRDTTIVIPFCGEPLDPMIVDARPQDPEAFYADMTDLNEQIQRLQLCDGTNFYDAVERAYEVIADQPYEMFSSSVILMTDGQSNTDTGSFGKMSAKIDDLGLSGVIPVYGIRFGDFDPAQIQEIADLTGGRYFDASVDLVKAYREAKGYG